MKKIIATAILISCCLGITPRSVAQEQEGPGCLVVDNETDHGISVQAFPTSGMGFGLLDWKIAAHKKALAGAMSSMFQYRTRPRVKVTPDADLSWEWKPDFRYTVARTWADWDEPPNSPLFGEKCPTGAWIVTVR
jgi:hypothetical protein